MADTNPPEWLHEALADAAGRPEMLRAIERGLIADEWVGHDEPLTRADMTMLANAAFAGLAEFIGDGLLDANGQRKKPVQVGWASERAEWNWEREGRYALIEFPLDRGIRHDGERWGDVPVFVLERSETDQEGQ